MPEPGYEHTNSGLLKRRAQLFNEAEQLRDRIAEIRNDIDAIDRVLLSLGYEGDLDAAMPRQKRAVIFGRGELTRAIMGELRLSKDMLTSRDIAQAIVSLNGQDKRDRRYVADLTKRVSKALRVLAAEGRVKRATDMRGGVVWGTKRL